MMLKEILGRHLDVMVGDGISSELSTQADELKFHDYWENVESHFFVLKAREMKTRRIEDFIDIVKDPEKWAEHSELMDRYFDDDIDMFPYEHTKDSASNPQTSQSPPATEQNSSSLDPATDTSKAQSRTTLPLDAPIPAASAPPLIKPERFFHIQIDLIERRFPLGRTNDIGDGDLRDLVSSFRAVFALNYWQLIMSRRIWTVIGAAIILAAALLTASLALYFVEHGALDFILPAPGYRMVAVVAAALVALILVGVVEFLVFYVLSRRYETLKERYVNAVRTSCAILRAPLNNRLQNLVQIINPLFIRVEQARTDYPDGELDHWPEEAKKWIALALWMARRVEYIQFFVQVEMWRVRRIHYAMKTMAGWLSVLIFVCSSAVIGLIWLSACAIGLGHFGDGLGDRLLIGVSVTIAALVGIGLISKASYTAGIPQLNLVEDNLQTAELQGYKDTKLHNELGDVVLRTLKLLLREERRLRAQLGS
jgi:hypothetical protein